MSHFDFWPFIQYSDYNRWMKFIFRFALVFRYSFIKIFINICFLLLLGYLVDGAVAVSFAPSMDLRKNLESGRNKLTESYMTIFECQHDGCLDKYGLYLKNFNGRRFLEEMKSSKAFNASFLLKSPDFFILNIF